MYDKVIHIIYFPSILMPYFHDLQISGEFFILFITNCIKIFWELGYGQFRCNSVLVNFQETPCQIFWMTTKHSFGIPTLTVPMKYSSVMSCQICRPSHTTACFMRPSFMCRRENIMFNLLARHKKMFGSLDLLLRRFVFHIQRKQGYWLYQRC